MKTVTGCTKTWGKIGVVRGAADVVVDFPYHPWDWYIYLHEWLISKVKRFKGTPNIESHMNENS